MRIKSIRVEADKKHPRTKSTCGRACAGVLARQWQARSVSGRDEGQEKRGLFQSAGFSEKPGF
jgi:hypothetical protein